MTDVLFHLQNSLKKILKIIAPNELQEIESFLHGDSSLETTNSQYHKNQFNPCKYYDYIPVALTTDVNNTLGNDDSVNYFLANDNKRFKRVLDITLESGTRTSTEQSLQQGRSGLSRPKNLRDNRLELVDTIRQELDVFLREVKEASVPVSHKRNREQYEGRTPGSVEQWRALLVIQYFEESETNSSPNFKNNTRENLFLLLNEVKSLVEFYRIQLNYYNSQARPVERRFGIHFSVLVVVKNNIYQGKSLLNDLLLKYNSCYYFRSFEHHKDDHGSNSAHRERVWRLDAMWDNSMHLSLSQEKDDTQFNRLLYSGAGNNFYLRKENIPFVLFVVDCLRKFPVLIHKSVFNVMKTVWCFRHSLKDVLNNFHFLFIQFKTYESAFLTDGKAEERHGTGGVSRRVRNSVVDVLTDGKDVLNILFDTAFKIVNTNSANGGEANKDGMVEESTLFLLLYQSLINGESEPANNFSYLLKIKALHTVLLSIYQRECNVQHGDHSQASCAVCSTLSEEERIRHTLRHLLPFLTVNHFAKMEPAPYGPPSGIIKVPLYLFPSRIVFPIHVFVKRFVLDFFSFADGTPGKENFYAFSTSEVLKVLYILYHNESNPLTKSKQNKSELSFEFIKSICQVSEKALLFIVKELEMNHLVTVDHAAKSIKLIKG